jgi:phage-related baseplate assembly protein
MAEFDFTTYPPPQAIEEIDADLIVSGHIAAFIREWDVMRAERPELNLPPFNAEQLESEETRVLFEATSYRELLMRVRVNESVRANLLAFATGADLDHLAAFYGVVRMVSGTTRESDARLRLRVILEIQGRSTGGTAPRYRARAMASSLRVDNVEVYREGRNPTVHVAVFSTDNDGLADASLLSTVRAAVEAPDVRMVNDTLAVRAAVFEVVNIAADVWLLPSTPDTAIEALATGLRQAWADESGLGFDLNRAWIIARLMRGGVQKAEVAQPGSDVVALPYRAISLGTITLTNRGRGY